MWDTEPLVRIDMDQDDYTDSNKFIEWERHGKRGDLSINEMPRIEITGREGA